MKLAIISGGSRGLGAALVSQLKTDGYTVRELSRSGQLTESIKLDLSKPDTVSAVAQPLFAELARQTWERVVFINNAGVVSPAGMIANKSADAIVANINVNFTGAILLMREFVAAFQSADCPKQLANISSGAALRGIYGWSLYCAAKAGIEHFVRTVAVEQAEQPHPIHTLNIGPGIIDTAMQAEIRTVSTEDFPSVQRFIDFKENGQLRSPAEVAAGIRAMLAADLPNGSRHNVDTFL